MGRYVAVGGTIYLEFPTQTLAGAKATLSGTPVISAYKDDSLVQTTAGITLTVDHDGITGCNVVKVDTSADGTFYSSGAQIRLRITTGTVDSINVAGDPVGEFTMGVANSNVASMSNGALTASAIAASALNGKGDWNTTTPPTSVAIRQEIDTNSAQLAAILQDTGTTLPDQIAALNVGGGTGARSVTITITDGSDPLENVNVRVTQGIESYVQSTNASGVATFSLDDATWTVRAAKAGYTLANQTLVVNGTETATYAMSAVALSQPANPALVSHNVLCTGIDGQPEPGAIVYYRATAGTGTAGYSRDAGEATATANANGLATLTFIIGCTYEIRRGTIGRVARYVASATTPPETLGAP